MLLPNLSGLSTADRVTVLEDGKTCPITLHDFEPDKKETAWQLKCYINPRLPEGSGIGERDNPANITTEDKHYYDIVALGEHLSKHPTSPTTRAFVVISDRLECIKAANDLLGTTKQLKVPDLVASPFWDIGESNPYWYLSHDADSSGDDWSSSSEEDYQDIDAEDSPARAWRLGSVAPATTDHDDWDGFEQEAGPGRGGVTGGNFIATGRTLYEMMADAYEVLLEAVEREGHGEDFLKEALRSWVLLALETPSQLYALWYVASTPPAHVFGYERDRRMFSEVVREIATVVLADASTPVTEPLSLRDWRALRLVSTLAADNQYTLEIARLTDLREDAVFGREPSTMLFVQAKLINVQRIAAADQFRQLGDRLATAFVEKFMFFESISIQREESRTYPHITYDTAVKLQYWLFENVENVPAILSLAWRLQALASVRFYTGHADWGREVAMALPSLRNMAIRYAEKTVVIDNLSMRDMGGWFFPPENWAELATSASYKRDEELIRRNILEKIREQAGDGSLR